MMECEALRLCGHCLIRLKQFDAADRCLVMCMDVALKVEMPALIANVHIAQGQLASQREPPDYPKALKHHEAARVIARECEDISAEAAACLNCANTMGKMGDKERGMELQYEALGLRRKQVADAQLEIAEAKKILDENPPASTESVPEGTATQEQAAAAAATEDPTQVKRRRAMMDLANSKRSLQEARRAEAAAPPTSPPPSPARMGTRRSEPRTPRRCTNSRSRSCDPRTRSRTSNWSSRSS